MTLTILFFVVLIVLFGLKPKVSDSLTPTAELQRHSFVIAQFIASTSLQQLGCCDSLAQGGLIVQRSQHKH